MRRALLWAVYAVYLVAVAYLVWDPNPTVPSSAVWRVWSAFDSVGVPMAVSTVEFGLNVLLFVPMSLLGAFVFRRLRIADWVLIGFSASFGVEMVQKFVLPGRSADTRDIVSNTLGALIGALIARPIVLWLQRRNPTAEEPAAAPPVVEEPAKPASRNHATTPEPTA